MSVTLTYDYYYVFAFSIVDDYLNYKRSHPCVDNSCQVISRKEKNVGADFRGGSCPPGDIIVRSLILTAFKSDFFSRYYFGA